MNLTKRIKQFLQNRRAAYRVLNVLVAAVLFLWAYDGVVTSYNTTLLAFSYRYGFISRALLGTIYQGLNHILPFDLLSYLSVLRFFQIVTGLVFLLAIWLFDRLIRTVSDEGLRSTEVLILFYEIFFFTMFSNRNNFGRIDLFLVTISGISAYLLARQKCEWLVPVLAAAGVMFHQGYVFMFANVVLVLLFYRWMSGAACSDKIAAKKYGILFCLTFLVISALFLYFEFFSRANGEAIVGQIIHDARLLTKNEDYHPTLIDHEILGIDLTLAERVFHTENFLQLPIFLVLFSPYIVFLIKLFADVFKRVKSSALPTKCKYLAVACGWLTLLPNFILKCDYGRWIFAGISYFCIVFLALLAIGDEPVTNAFQKRLDFIRKKGKWTKLCLLYPLIFVPLMDVYICQWMKDLTDFIDARWLHLF